ncbi:MAG: hypothetical protein R2883_03395 [Caldisericia bacterium]
MRELKTGGKIDRKTINRNEAKDNATAIISEVESGVAELSAGIEKNSSVVKTLVSSWKIAENGATKLKAKLDETTKSLHLSALKMREMASEIGTEFGSSLTSSINKSLTELPDLMFNWE